MTLPVPNITKYYFHYEVEKIMPFITPGFKHSESFLALQYFLANFPNEVFNLPEEGKILKTADGQQWILTIN